jgi:hypothetical protein
MTRSYTLRNNITLSAKAKALLTVPQTFVKGTYRIKERMPAEYLICVFFNKIRSPRASEMPLRVAQPAYDVDLPESEEDSWRAALLAEPKRHWLTDVAFKNYALKNVH